MTALLTDNLPLLAGAPNGIKKLRELILELAVRGKLVPQDLSDEPAYELLKRIAEEKAQQVAEGKIKKQKPVPNIGEAEKSFELPTGWAWQRFADFALDVSTGPFGSLIHQSDYVNDGVPLVNPSHMIDGRIVADHSVSLSIEMAENLDSYRLTAGDMVMARRGEVGRVALVTEAEEGWLCGTGSFLLRFTPEVSREYVRTLFRCNSVRTYLAGAAVGMTMVNLNHGILLKMPIAVPPADEQSRIIAKLDELMTLCDRLEAQQAEAESSHTQLAQAILSSLGQASDATEFATSWQRLAKHFHTLFTSSPSIDTLKQTLLQLAVMGKLVPQNSDDEPASKLVERIQTEKQRYLAKSKTRKQKELATDSRQEPPFEVPAGWEWQTIDDVLHVTGGVPLGRKLGGRKLLSKPYLRVANVQRGRLELDHVKEVEVPEDEIEKYLLQNGDLLITEGGDWDKVGRTATWRNELPECLHQNHVFRARAVIADWEPRWAEMYLNSTSAREYFAGSSKQTTNLASINMTQLRMCAFPLPPLSEQHRIISKVDQLMALCDQLKNRLIQARQLNEQLASAMVERSLADDGQPAPATPDQKFIRTLLAAEITHQLHAQRTFGQRKLQKVIYLAEHAANVSAIQGDYLRDAAGPHDRQLMNQVEGELQKYQWYERTERETVGYTYRPLPQAGQHQQAYTNTWSAAERATIEQVIGLMRDWDTDRCEMVVTLYAAWNDFILEGRTYTDDAIVDEVMHRWNDTKLRFSKIEWLAVLAEMKKHKILLPTGFGKRTKGGMLSLPGFE